MQREENAIYRYASLPSCVICVDWVIINIDRYLWYRRSTVEERISLDGHCQEQVKKDEIMSS